MRLFFGILLLSALGCQSSQLRSPSHVSFEFNAEKTQLLTWAAQNKILFLLPDSTFEDVQLTQVQDSCKKLGEPAWSQAVLNTLSQLKKSPSLQNRVHVIEIKHGDSPKVEVTKDLDGVTYLVLSYAKVESKSKISDVSQIPCENKSSLYIGEELTQVSFDLPNQQMIAKTLKELPPRQTPERWKFSSDFLVHLAKKLTILKYTSELGFERAANGDFLLVQFLNEQAQAIKSSQFKSFDYWLAEITQRSHSGSYLKILALVQDKDLPVGVNISEKSRGLAYPFLSYRPQDGSYKYTSLSQLNSCLEQLSFRYKRGLASIRPEYSTTPDSFLTPGHTCYEVPK